LGRVARGCSRRPTSTAHKETRWQRYHSAAAVTAACSPQQNVFRDVPPTQAFLGARPREDPRRRISSLRAEASVEHKICISTPLAGVRGLRLYGTCFPTAASEQSNATDGITVDTPLNNARVCTYREKLNRQSQAHRGSRKSSCQWRRRKMPTGTEPMARRLYLVHVVGIRGSSFYTAPRGAWLRQKSCQEISCIVVALLIL
jgi:hypothetical protein